VVNSKLNDKMKMILNVIAFDDDIQFYF